MRLDLLPIVLALALLTMLSLQIPRSRGAYDA